MVKNDFWTYKYGYTVRVKLICYQVQNQDLPVQNSISAI